MKNILEEALKKICDLLNYVKRLQEINVLVKMKNEDALSIKIQELNGESSKRVFDYNLSIITLYGILEGFIEQIAKAYLKDLAKSISSYSKLPEIIRRNHLQFSADLIKNCKKMSKYSHISEDSIIVNLYNCISGNKISLNVEAFTNHSSNFRKDTIREFFKNIGIDNITRGICNDEQFRKYFYTYEGLDERDLKIYTEDGFFNILEEIVERRNAIAHGNEVDDILSLNILESYIYYVEELIHSIFRICENNLIQLKLQLCSHVSLGEPTEVYDNSIIGIYSQNNFIEVGMIIYGKNKVNNKIKYGKVVSIQHDGKDINKVEEQENILIGIKVDFRAKKNWEYGILNKS